MSTNAVTVPTKTTGSFSRFFCVFLLACMGVMQVVHMEKVHQMETKVMKAEFEAQMAKQEMEKAKLALANALIPEATVTEALKNHIVTPTKEAAANAWNSTKEAGSTAWHKVKSVFAEEPAAPVVGLDWEAMKQSVLASLAEVREAAK